MEAERTGTTLDVKIDSDLLPKADNEGTAVGMCAKILGVAYPGAIGGTSTPARVERVKVKASDGSMLAQSIGSACKGRSASP